MSQQHLRVVVTADNHLSPRLPRLAPDRARQRRRIVRDAFGTIVQAAIAQEADLFVIAGDLFDRPDPTNEDRTWVAEQLALLHQHHIMICAVSGNHDMPRQSAEQGGLAPLDVYRELGALHYFPQTRIIQPISLNRRGIHLVIAGLSNDPSRRPGEDPLADVSVDDADHLLTQAHTGLLIVHAAIEGETRVGPDECLIRAASIERLSGFQTVVTGHIHQYQQRRIGAVETIVCGPSERMDFGDAYDAPGYALLEIGLMGLASARHVRLAAQPRHTVQIEAIDIWPADHPPEEATDIVLERLAGHCTPDAFVRFFINGTATRAQYRALDLARIQAFGREQAFAFSIHLDQLSIIDERIVAISGMTGERVDPRLILTEALGAHAALATNPDEVALWEETRVAVLGRLDDDAAP